MTQSAIIAGVGMTPFSKPSEGARYEEIAPQAIRQALQDAGIDYSDVQQVFAGWVYGDSTSGQRAVYPVGLTGIPIVNVNNNCASGSSALYLAQQLVSSGARDCVLAVGFEQMAPGALDFVFQDRTPPLDKHLEVSDRLLDTPDGLMTPRAFAAAGREQIETHGVALESYAKIAVKARRHAAANERAVLRDEITVEQVLESKEVLYPVTRFQCCPPTSGAAAAIVCSPAFARAHGIDDSVIIRAQSLVTDEPSAFQGSAVSMVGADISRRAAAEVYEAAGVAPTDLDIVELHDCFTINEAISYESLGLCAADELNQFIAEDQNTYGGQLVVNPSGGLLSKGHPLGATGLAQCFELVSQLKGRCGARQVADARMALAHNVGLGSAAVVTLFERRAG